MEEEEGGWVEEEEEDEEEEARVLKSVVSLRMMKVALVVVHFPTPPLSILAPWRGPGEGEHASNTNREQPVFRESRKNISSRTDRFRDVTGLGCQLGCQSVGCQD